MYALINLFGHEYRSEHHLTCIKRVNCDQCDTQYYFRMGRTGIGHGFSWLHLYNDSAIRRAQQRALEQATMLLIREAEMVSCPSCGHVSKALARGYARRCRFTRLGFMISLGVGVIGSLITGLLVDMIFARVFGTPERLVMMLALYIGFLGPLWGWCFVRLRRWRIAKRGSAQARRKWIPAGTPPAMLEDIDSQGRHWLETVVEENQLKRMGDSGVLISSDLDQTRLIFPSQCCVCMTKTSATEALPVRYSQAMVPVCTGCQRRTLVKWWGVTLLTGLFIYTAAAGCLLWIHNYTVPVKAAGIIAAIVISSLLIAGLIDWFIDPHVKPFHLELTDARRKLYRFKARHPDFNLMLITQQNKPQRVPFDPDDVLPL